MFVPDPDLYPSRISDPGSNDSNKEEGENLFVFFIVATNITKL